MHEESRVLFRQAILTSLPHLQSLVGQFFSPQLVWRKLDSLQWQGEFQSRPDIGNVFRKADRQIEEESAGFRESFVIRHPEYAGKVGFGDIQHNNWSKRVNIVRSALNSLWWRHKTFQLTEAQVDAIVQEFADFVDRPTVRLRFQG
jgi:hypothetical protein